MNLKGTAFTFNYSNTEWDYVPTTMSLSEARDMLTSLLNGDEWVQYMHLPIAGENKETWVALSEVRTIEVEEITLADLHTEASPARTKKGAKAK